MPISVTCPQCGKSYRVPDEKAGQSGRCSCGQVFKVPAPEAPDTVPLGPPPMAEAGLGPGGPVSGGRPLVGADQPLSGPAVAGTPGLRCPNCGVVAQFGASECAACGTALRKQSRTVAARRPAGVTALAILYSLVALALLSLGSSITTVAGGAAKGFVGAFGPGAAPAALSQGVTAGSFLALVLAVFLWMGAGWARKAWRVLLTFHLLFVAGMLGMAVYATRQVPVGLPGALAAIALALVFLGVLKSEAVARYCS